MGYTSSQENTGKTYQDKFMSDKQFQLKNMRKILKKIHCEEKKVYAKTSKKKNTSKIFCTREGRMDMVKFKS